MSDVKKDDDEAVHSVDTVPPPSGGDAYSSATVVREVPTEILEAIRRRKLEAAAAAKSVDEQIAASHRTPLVPKEDRAPAEEKPKAPSEPPPVETGAAATRSPEQALAAGEALFPEATASPPAARSADDDVPLVSLALHTEPSEDVDLSLGGSPERVDEAIFTVEPAAAPAPGTEILSPFAPSPRRNERWLVLALSFALAAVIVAWTVSLFR